jgi:deferrochelatase/peroxidase EfeB
MMPPNGVTAQAHEMPTQPKQGLTRRGVLSGAVAFGVGAGLNHVLSRDSTAATGDTSSSGSLGQSVPFYGAQQAGIATAAQDYLNFAAFDVTSEAVEDLREILEQWTAAALALTSGKPYQPGSQELSQPPVDPDEALGIGPARLTITIGFGPSLFGSPGADRFGLASRRPALLQPLPPFSGDSLEAGRSGGDLCVQACAYDPQVAFHAIHLFQRIAGGAATLRWSQLGFGRTSSTTRTQSTPRNLMGFKDGTDNIRAEEATAMSEYVWVGSEDGPTWMAGGTYLVARRIRILFDVWDTTSLEGQQRTIGREKLSGAPLGGTSEYDPVDLDATDGNGELAIPANAHIRIANPRNNDGQRILRRGYSYSEAAEPGDGELDAGLFFIAFQRSPERQFIPLQQRLAASDALNRHTLHTSSAIFACPPGIQPGGFIGEQLLA